MRNKLNNFLFENSNFASFFEKSIQVLILISILNFSVQTHPNLSVRLIEVLNIVELSSILIFSLEYLLRLFTSPKPFRFIFSFFGLIDLIAILPFYISMGIDLKSLRAVRLFRLLRLLKFFCYQDTLAKLKQSFNDVKRELFLFSYIFVAMWWSVATLNTLCYGDIYPITAVGEIFSTFIVFIGFDLFTILTGNVGSSMTKVLMKSKDQPF